MAWFDGTTDFEKDKFEKQFPIYITENLRTNDEKNKLAIINDFHKESKLYEISDPHLENGVYYSNTFFHIFIGKDAVKAKDAITDFASRGYGKGGYEISLYRKEESRLFFYSYGELYPECSSLPEISEYCEETANEEFYILPLKAFAFKCPVCGEKTIQYRGMFEICDFCGWEDEGIDGDDDEPVFGPNGDYTIRQYREAYKRKLISIYNKPFEMMTDEEKMLPFWR